MRRMGSYGLPARPHMRDLEVRGIDPDYRIPTAPDFFADYSANYQDSVGGVNGSAYGGSISIGTHQGKASVLIPSGAFQFVYHEGQVQTTLGQAFENNVWTHEMFFYSLTPGAGEIIEMFRILGKYSGYSMCTVWADENGTLAASWTNQGGYAIGTVPFNQWVRLVFRMSATGQLQNWVNGVRGTDLPGAAQPNFDTPPLDQYWICEGNYHSTPNSPESYRYGSKFWASALTESIITGV